MAASKSAGRLRGDVHRLDLAQAARLGQANRFIDQPAVVRRQSLAEHCRTLPVVSRSVRGTAASGAMSRTMPRFVFVATHVPRRGDRIQHRAADARC